MAGLVGGRAPRLSRVAALLAAVAGLSLGTQGYAAPDALASGAVALQQIGTFENPNYVTAAPGFPRLLFVVERKGQIAVLRDGKALPGSFLDIAAQVTTEAVEQGLIGLAFPPDYARSRHFYVQYVDRAGDLRIDEYSRRTPVFAPASSRRTLLTIPQVNGYTNHNGGQLQFRGRLLYAGVGDGADPGDVLNLAQNLISPAARSSASTLGPTPAAGPFGSPARTPSSASPAAT